MIIVALELSVVVWTDVLMAKVTDAHGIFTLDDGETEILLNELLLVVCHVLQLVLFLILSSDSIGALMAHVRLITFEKHVLVQDLGALLA